MLGFMLFLLVLVLVLSVTLAVMKKYRKYRYYVVHYRFRNMLMTVVYYTFSKNEAAMLFEYSHMDYSYYHVLNGVDEINDYYKQFLSE